MERYDHTKIEKKWQERWKESQLYTTSKDTSKPKSYVLDMFPYPSGEGLHVGHPKGYIATDIYSRMKRMQGHNVLHPMGWDAFGLPAENFALKNKIHPRAAVEKNIATFKDQLSHIGFNYDWSREINTTDPAYYKWTQWIFLQLYKKGLAFQSNEPINWCPSCMTGLANEDLDGNVCERCGSVVEKRALPQWVLKITAYADRMLTDLDALDWPEHIKTAQRNWIGKSEGSEIEFAITGSDKKIKVFTTRADTLFGATFLVVAPEHPLIQELSIENTDEVRAYVAAAAAKTEIERTNADKEKTGVELKGIKAINPVSKEEIPLFVADYVLGEYGTGAIMAVPAHDDRDGAFAKKFGIEIRAVISKHIEAEGEYAEKEGFETISKKVVDAIICDKDDNFYLIKEPNDYVHLVGGGIDEGETEEEALRREVVEETGFTDFTIGRKVSPALTFWGWRHIRNRNQRTTGSAYEVTLNSFAKTSSEVDAGDHEIISVPRNEVLGTMHTDHAHKFLFEQYLNEKPYTGDGILFNSGEYNDMSSEEARVKITEAVGGKMTSTYKIKDWVFSRQRYWGEPIPIIHCKKDGAVAVPDEQLPVLLPEVESYEPSGTGESPLATITDWVNTTCPTCGGPAKRETNTMPQWAGSSWYYLRFMDPDNKEALVAKDVEKYWAPVDVYVGGDHAVRHLIYARFWHKFLYDIGSVSTIEPFARLEFLGFILAEDGRKMSKRYGNVINPTDVINTYGADAFRTYEMFMGPFENTVAWSTASIAGTARFIERVYKIEPGAEEVKSLTPLLHQTIKKVSEDIEAFKFNTAISQMMILLNAIEKESSVSKEQWESLLRILAPFAPHVTDELWEKLGHTESIHTASWPTYDPAKTVADTVTVAIQINGKTRATIELPSGAGEEEALSAARSHADIAPKLSGTKELRAIYVPGKIINFVVQLP